MPDDIDVFHFCSTIRNKRDNANAVAAGINAFSSIVKSSQRGLNIIFFYNERARERVPNEKNMSGKSVLWYWPNLVGYLRIFLLGCALFLHPLTDDYKRIPYGSLRMDRVAPAIFYLASQALDMVDGPIARYFDQQTYFGMYLDMITDRISTLTLYFLVSDTQTKTVCALFASLDIWSHWLHMVVTFRAKRRSHKVGAQNPLLRLYYGNRFFMGSVCIGHEIALVLVYVCYMHWIVPALCLLFLAKVVIHAIQLFEAASLLAHTAPQHLPVSR